MHLKAILKGHYGINVCSYLFFYYLRCKETYLDVKKY